MKMRYKSDHPYFDVYRDFYILYKHNSEVFKTGRQIPNMSMVILDKKNIEIEILRRQSNEDDLYYKGNKRTMQIAMIRSLNKS